MSGPTGDGRFLTFDGAVSGTGSFAGNVRFEGGLSPGASPALQQASTVVFAATNTLHMELGGHVRGTEYDAIDATGSITLGGSLEVVLLGQFVPGAGDVFDLLSASHITGSFASQVFPTLGAGLTWHTAILAGQTGEIFQLTVAAVPEPSEWLLIIAGGVLLAARRRRG
ncbi:MAG: PEP-CTERM sorting domain-containing protein [Burkholderiales bacterium]